MNGTKTVRVGQGQTIGYTAMPESRQNQDLCVSARPCGWVLSLVGIRRMCGSFSRVQWKPSVRAPMNTMASKVGARNVSLDSCIANCIEADRIEQVHEPNGGGPQTSLMSGTVIKAASIRTSDLRPRPQSTHSALVSLTRERIKFGPWSGLGRPLDYSDRFAL